MTFSELWRENYVSVSRAIQDTWDEFDGGTGMIDISEFLDVVEGIASKMGKTRQDLFSERDLESYREFKAKNEGIKVFREDFERLFEALAGCELNSQIFDKQQVQQKQEKDDDDDDDDDNNSVASISQTMQPPIDTSTPLVRKRGSLLAPNKSNLTRTALEELDVNRSEARRVSSHNRILADQESQIKSYEERISQMEKERNDFENQLKRCREQLREVQHSDQEKDNHIKAIETDLMDTHQRLERKSPPRVVYPKSNEMAKKVEELTEKVELLEKEKAEIKRSAEKLMDQVAQQQKKMLEEKRRQEMFKQDEESLQQVYDKSSLAQRIHIAIDQQRQLLTRFSNEGQVQDNQLYFVIATFFFALILTRFVTSTMTAAKGPWWVGTAFETPAAQMDSWIRGSDIYPI